MIRTEHVKPERYEYSLKKTGTKKEEYDKEIEELGVSGFGLLSYATKKTVKAEREYDVYGHDEEAIRKLKPDQRKQVRDYSFEERGYPTYGMRGWTHYYSSKDFTREFPVTLNEFYKKFKIKKDNLISMEYCKTESSCSINGAYISWEDGK